MNTFRSSVLHVARNARHDRTIQSMHLIPDPLSSSPPRRSRRLLESAAAAGASTPATSSCCFSRSCAATSVLNAQYELRRLLGGRRGLYAEVELRRLPGGRRGNEPWRLPGGRRGNSSKALSDARRFRFMFDMYSCQRTKFAYLVARKTLLEDRTPKALGLITRKLAER